MILNNSFYFFDFFAKIERLTAKKPNIIPVCFRLLTYHSLRDVLSHFSGLIRIRFALLCPY
jgi:hypothetical protein